MAFKIETLVRRKSDLENLLLLLDKNETTLKSLIRSLTIRLQTRVLDKKMKTEDGILHHFDNQVIIPVDENHEIFNDQYLKTPSLMVEPEFNEVKRKLFNHKVRLDRNATFSWSYQSLF